MAKEKLTKGLEIFSIICEKPPEQKQSIGKKAFNWSKTLANKVKIWRAEKTIKRKEGKSDKYNANMEKWKKEKPSKEVLSVIKERMKLEEKEAFEEKIKTENKEIDDMIKKKQDEGGKINESIEKYRGKKEQAIKKINDYIEEKKGKNETTIQSMKISRNEIKKVFDRNKKTIEDIKNQEIRMEKIKENIPKAFIKEYIEQKKKISKEKKKLNEQNKRIEKLIKKEDKKIIEKEEKNAKLDLKKIIEKEEKKQVKKRGGVKTRKKEKPIRLESSWKYRGQEEKKPDDELKEMGKKWNNRIQKMSSLSDKEREGLILRPRSLKRSEGKEGMKKFIKSSIIKSETSSERKKELQKIIEDIFGKDKTKEKRFVEKYLGK